MTVDPRKVFANAHPPSSVLVEGITPLVDGGRYAVKRVVGDLLVVEADVFKDGHDKIGAVLRVRRVGDERWSAAPMAALGNDRWSAFLALEEIGRHEYEVEGFPDLWATWLDGTRKKLAAGLDIALELKEGALIVEDALGRASNGAAVVLNRAIATLRYPETPADALDDVASPDLAALLVALRDPARSATAGPFPLWVDRQKARYAAWYEIFPRSAGSVDGQSATFQDVIDQLPRIAAMGFDVLYFPPIHPIGHVNRKGKNNSVTSLPGEPGSPYAIGSHEGGHDAIEPQLGDFDDFARLQAAANAYGLEIAIDFAVQAAPDHPWVTGHPDWFTMRPDGSIKYAENPPKRYEDIYPIDFTSADWKNLWAELRRLFLFWAERGARIFRVDNPHTKPTVFWEWLIEEVHLLYPDALFLSEAFTRPKVMRALAKAGYTQSYSYFTWRVLKQEIADYLTELTATDLADVMRANFFVNTPDIAPYHLQTGGRAMFRIRHILAATSNSLYGMYSGYELCEAEPVPGKEEYLHSEKYEFKVRDWLSPGNIIPEVTRINEIRRAHPALHGYTNLRVFWAEDDQTLCYGKTTPDHTDNILVVLNLDPRETRAGRIWFDPTAFGFEADEEFLATDLLSGERWRWRGGDQWVRLDPAVHPAHIIHLTRLG